jgi:hypothetical protein
VYDALARELSEETALAYAGTVAHAYGVHYLVPGLAVAPAQRMERGQLLSISSAEPGLPGAEDSGRVRNTARPRPCFRRARLTCADGRNAA